MAKTNVLGLGQMGTIGTVTQRYSNQDHNVTDPQGVGVLSPKEVNPMGVSPISGNCSGMEMSDGGGGCTRGAC